MFCSNCGRKISERDTVCPHCGSPVEEEFFNGFCRISVQKGEKDSPSASIKQRVSDQHVQHENNERGTGRVSETQGKQNKEKEQFPVQILIGIIGLLLFLLIIQSIRLGIAGHEGRELRQKNVELEKAQVELMHKYDELQQSLAQSENHDGQEQDGSGQSESTYSREEVSNHEDNSENGQADAQSLPDDDLLQNEAGSEESSPDSAHEDNGQDDDINTGGVYEE